MKDFLVALGMVLVIEGLIFALSPSHLRRVLALVNQLPDRTIVMMGLLALSLGVVMIGLVKVIF